MNPSLTFPFLPEPFITLKEDARFMSFTPDEANDRFYELGKKNAAKVLYGAYCRFRNVLTGRTNVHNDTIAERYGINACQISTSKTELLEAGWIFRDPDELKYGVIPVMGAREFQERRSWKWLGMKEEDRWAFLHQRLKIWNYKSGRLEPSNFRTLASRAVGPDLEIPNLTVSTPDDLNALNLEFPNSRFGISKSDEGPSLLSLPYIEPSNAVAAAPPDLEIPNLTVSTPQPSEVCDAEYLERVIQAKRYPPELDEADVRRLFSHCTFDAEDRQQLPTKKLFLGYLRREAEEKLRRGQLVLPGAGGAQMVTPRFDANARPASAAAATPGNVTYPLRPNAQCGMCEGRDEFRTSSGLYCQCRICQKCFGYGMESTPKGARRCQHLTGESDKQRARTG